MKILEFYEGADRCEVRANNLLKLAAYLLKKLPSNFTMRFFAKMIPRPVDTDSERFARQLPCGSVGCAIGHGPNAGILPMENEEWADYSYRTLLHAYPEVLEPGDNFRDDWHWCFSLGWANVDDTPDGAGLRILAYLRDGLPPEAKGISRRFIQEADQILMLRVLERKEELLAWMEQNLSKEESC